MAKRDNETITLGSGILYCTEFKKMKQLKLKQIY